MTVTAVAVAAVGLACVAIGLRADASKWWPEHPFATNVASSFACALVGIPVTVTLLGTVLERVRRRQTISHETEVAREACRALLSAGDEMALFGLEPEVAVLRQVTDLGADAQWMVGALHSAMHRRWLALRKDARLAARALEGALHRAEAATTVPWGREAERTLEAVRALSDPIPEDPLDAVREMVVRGRALIVTQEDLGEALGMAIPGLDPDREPDPPEE